MRLRSDLSLLPLDDDVVVFSEEAQCLVDLNASAAHVMHKALAGAELATITNELVSEGLSADEAGRWVAMVNGALSSHGLLSDGAAPAPRTPGMWDEKEYLERIARTMPAYVPAKVVAEQRYRLLNTCALVRFTHLAQVRLVDSVIGHFTTNDMSVPTVIFEIQVTPQKEHHLGSDIYRDGQPIACATRLSRLAPLMKAVFWSSTINAFDYLYYIHAGVVGTVDACVLLPAAPGCGKSSLTAALVHRGYQYFSDEVALIEPETFWIAPMPLSLCVKRPGWDLIARYYPEILQVPTHGREDGKVVRYIPPPRDRIPTASAPARHIIFPRYDAHCLTELKAIKRSEALRRLMEECVSLSQKLSLDNVRGLVRWISSIECYALTFSSLEGASELVAHVIDKK